MKKKHHKFLFSLVALSVFWQFWFSGCHDVGCARQHDSWFKAKFDPNVPLFLTPESGQSILNKINDSEQKKAVEETLRLLSKPLPKFDHPVSCAVVGNSDNVLGRGNGVLIDSHDIVFRMNNAPTEGYEKDVGTKTTFHVIHSAKPYIANYGAETITLFYIDVFPYHYVSSDSWSSYEKSWLIPRFRMMASQISPEKIPNVVIPIIRGEASFPTNIFNLREGGLLVIHPEFIRYSARNWFDRPYDKSRKADDRPSTGFRTLVLAFHLCDKISIFGFGARKDGFWAHYFDHDSVSWHEKAGNFHRKDYQEQFINYLSHRAILIIY